jgi:serine/threonine-protein kinase
MGRPVVSAGEPEPPSTEEEFSLWLAACDEQLAAGATAVSLDELGAPVALRPRLEREAIWCQSIRRIWHHAGDTLTVPVPPSIGDAPPALDPVPGRIERFQIRRELGRGAFGVVYLAYDPRLRREVALKVPRDEIVMNAALRARFRHEAMAAAGLDHP